MELRQLAYFVGVARAGSFSKAAGFLRIAQPALSRQIALLEKELGALLLTRNGRGAIPTPAGDLFLSRANEILRSVEEAKWQLASLSKTPSQPIRVGVPLSISKLLTPDLFEGVKAVFPQISLQISEAWTGHIYQDLLDRKLDFGIISNSQLGDKIFHRQLVTEQVHLIKAPHQPPSLRSLRFAELANVPLVLPPPKHGIRLIVDRIFQRYSMKPRIVLESEVWAVITDVVKKGIASTLFPPREVKGELEGGTLQNIPIINPTIRNRLCLARLSENSLPPYTEPIFEFMVKQFRKMIRAATADHRH